VDFPSGQNGAGSNGWSKKLVAVGAGWHILRFGVAWCGSEPQWLQWAEPAWVEPKITPLAQTPQTAASSRFPEPHVCWHDVRLGSGATLTAPPAPPCWYPIPLAAAGSTEVLPHKTGSNTIVWHGRTLYCSLL
jgi:hypothetical protein